MGLLGGVSDEQLQDHDLAFQIFHTPSHEPVCLARRPSFMPSPCCPLQPQSWPLPGSLVNYSLLS